MKPCKRGHVSARSPIDGKCIECRRTNANLRYLRKLERDGRQRRGPNQERLAAISAGEKWYMPATACKNGHVSKRRTSTNRCEACNQAWAESNPSKMLMSGRKWRAQNPERSRAFTAAWAAANPDKNREKNKNWHVKNKDRNNSRARQWQRDNRERAAAISKIWKSANKESINVYARNRRARVRGLGGKHTVEDVVALRVQQKNKCAYCRINLAKAVVHVDHIIPLKIGGGNARSNLQLLCETCNLSKGIKHPLDYARSTGRLI